MTYLRTTNEPRETQSLLPQLGINVALMVLVVIASLQLAPSVIEQGRDSGIFAYTGKVIREGGLPYRDAWDNKLPGVYYVDALAFVLFGTNRWALWLMEGISLFLTGRLVFWLVNHVYGRRMLAWVGALTLVLMARNPALVSDTNFTEVYALLPQVLCFVAGYQFYRHPSWRWAFAVGLAAGAAFLFKQTTIGGALAFIPATLLARHPVIRSPRRWLYLGATLVGGLSSLGVVASYLYGNGVLGKAIDATFVAPMAFHRWVSEQPVSAWDTLRQTLTGSVFPLVVGPLLPFLVVGLFVALRPVFSRRHREAQPAIVVTMALWAALTFPIDLALTNVTHRAYEHYYVTIVPSLVLLLALSLDVFQRRLHLDQPDRQLTFVRAGIWAYLVLAVVTGPLAGTLVRLWLVDWDVTGPTRHMTLTEYVLENTEPEDYVLVWGASTAINFEAERNSPVSYHYGYPLIVPGYTTPEQIEEIVGQLAASLPLLIVDTTLRDGIRIPPLDAERRKKWWEMGGRQDVADLDLLFDFVADHCEYVTEVDEAAIYTCQ